MRGFHVGGLGMNPCILAVLVVWQLTPRGQDHGVLIEEDLILMYYIMNKIKVNWIFMS